MEHILTEPFTKDKLEGLAAGDTVLLSGTIYTARDAAHKKLVSIIEDGGIMPFDIENSIIYYAGPTPAKPGCPIGSAGPTTSYRMDSFAPDLLEIGLSGMIGKGPRNENVKAKMTETGAVYFAAIGGAAALIAQSVTDAEVVAFEELGTEAIRKLTVKDMPLVVAVDSRGADIYSR